MRPNASRNRIACVGAVLLGAGAMVLAGNVGCAPEGDDGPGVDERYEIVVERIGRIGERDGDGMIIGTVLVNFLVDGRISLNDLGDPGRVKLYSRDGTFLGAFGQLGQGPGELQRPDHQCLTPSGDTLIVLDTGQGRITRWAADGSVHYDTRLFPVSMVVLCLGDGRVVLNSPSIDPEGHPLPLRLTGREEGLIRAFGTPYRPDLPDDTRPAQRLLTRGAGGTIWEAPLFEYRLALWDTLGNVLQELRGTHLEMPPPERAVINPRRPTDPPPTPWLGGIGWDEDQEVLWVSVLVAREDWAARLASRPNPGWPTIEERYGEEAIRRTQLDAWDPARGRVVASTLLEERWLMPIGPGIGVSYWSSPEGFLFLDVWRASLAEKSR